jgi:hypothetical protein
MAQGQIKAKQMARNMSALGHPPISEPEGWAVRFPIVDDYSLSVSYNSELPDGVLETALFKGTQLVYEADAGYENVCRMDDNVKSVLDELERLKTWLQSR